MVILRTPGSIKILNIYTGKIESELVEHNLSINSRYCIAEIAPNIVAIDEGANGLVSIWDLTQAKRKSNVIKTVINVHETIHFISGSIADKGDSFCIGTVDCVYFYAIDNFICKRKIKFDRSNLSYGNYLYTKDCLIYSMNRNIHLIKLNQMNESRILYSEESIYITIKKMIISVKFGLILYINSRDEIKIIDWENGNLLWKMEFNNVAKDICILENGDILVSGRRIDSKGNNVYLYS